MEQEGFLCFVILICITHLWINRKLLFYKYTFLYTNMELYILFTIVMIIIILEFICLITMICCECYTKELTIDQEIPEAIVIRNPGGNISIAYEVS